MKRFLLLLIFPFCAISLLYGTHIVGGEITYKCLGDDRYDISLTVYRDCYTGVPWFDDPAAIGVYDANWNLVKTILVNWDVLSNDTLPIVLENPCLVVPPNVCVNRTTYRTTQTLPFKTGGYTLVYQRCCRNELIKNIPNPLDVGISIIANLSEKTMLKCNSSAVFNKWPPVAICANLPIDFDHSATDPDGDSLVYRLCTPLNGANKQDPRPVPPFPGPYLEVVWNSPPYNLANVLGGDPLAINPATGFMTGVPNTIGNFVVGVCVDEYRGDTLISTTRRDFQYNVAACGVPTAAFVDPVGACETEIIRFVNQSNVPNVRWYFDWPNDLTKTTTEFSPQYQFPDTGSFTVALITAPGLPCADTMLRTIHIGAFHIDAAMITQLPLCDNNGLVIQAFDKSVDSVYGIASWSWRLTGSGGFSVQSTAQNPTFIITKPGSYKLTLIALSAGGCRDTIVKQIQSPVPRIDSLLEELTICPGDTVRLNSGGIDGYEYEWTPGATLSDTTAFSPLAFPLVTTDYLVTITNAICTYEGMVTVFIVDTSALAVSATPPIIYLGETSQLLALHPGTAPISWTPANTLNNPSIRGPIAEPSETTTYTARISYDGCVLERSVTVTVLFPNCDEPFVFFPTGFSPNGDGENDVLRLETRFAEEVYWAVYNRWGQKLFETYDPAGEWDGTFEGKTQPVETYGYYYRVRCRGGVTSVKKGNVTLLR
ncbi:MAG: gliding motility-associated C-terminal domain-containing protein [Saprospiraceae bacterium]